MGAPLLKRQSLKQVVPVTAQPIPSRPYSALSDSCLGRAYQRSMEGHGKIMRWESWSQVFLPITLKTEIGKRATIFRQDFFLRLFCWQPKGYPDLHKFMLPLSYTVLRENHFRSFQMMFKYFEMIHQVILHLFFRWSFLDFNMFQLYHALRFPKPAPSAPPAPRNRCHDLPTSPTSRDPKCLAPDVFIHQKDTKTHCDPSHFPISPWNGWIYHQKFIEIPLI